jgi:dephospho-CoA kinase
MTASALKVAGLTGGIASGKSTVARWFADWGAFVVDADQVSRDVVAPDGVAFDAVVERFGTEILDHRGRVDRARLGRLVFDDADERRALEAILHPAIREESLRRFDNCDAPLGVYEASLLVETGVWKEFDWLIVAACSFRTQLERLIARDGLDHEQAHKRLAAQLPLEQKVELADYVIDTGGSLAETERNARVVYEALTAP